MRRRSCAPAPMPTRCGVGAHAYVQAAFLQEAEIMSILQHENLVCKVDGWCVQVMFLFGVDARWGVARVVQSSCRLM